MGCRSLLQGTFHIQGSNSGLPNRRQSLYHLNHQGIHTEKPSHTPLPERPPLGGMCAVLTPRLLRTLPVPSLSGDVPREMDAPVSRVQGFHEATQ